MRVAALDLGSNTSLLLIADVTQERMLRVIHDETRITRLGQGVHADRCFHPSALSRMAICLQEYRQQIDRFRCDQVCAVATSAARDVSNAQELLELGRRFNIPIHIITGQREAALTFKGALCDRMRTDELAVIDVGGGSTEIIANSIDGPSGTSVDVGSVRLSEMFVTTDPVSKENVASLRAYVDQAFAVAPLPAVFLREVVAVAGTPTTLAALQQVRPFQEHLVHGFKLTLEQIEQWIARLAQLSLLEREKLPGMQPQRADVIVVGAIILSAAIRHLKKSEVTVSTRGVRFGVALNWDQI